MNKKVIMTIAAVSLAGAVMADLSTVWFNQTKAIYNVGGSGGAGPFVVGGVVQLVWSPTGIQTTTAGLYGVLASAIRGESSGLSGEYVLANSTTANYGFFDGASGIYTSADVGGANINSGWFFTRVYQATGAGGEYFLDTDAIDASEWVYNPGPPPDASTVYSDPALSDNVWVDQNGSQVVPEPGTIGLMGVAGLGMFLARKKARR